MFSCKRFNSRAALQLPFQVRVFCSPAISSSLAQPTLTRFCPCLSAFQTAGPTACRQDQLILPATLAEGTSRLLGSKAKLCRNESERVGTVVLIPPNLLGFVGVGVLLGLLCLLVGCCVDSGIFKDNVRMEVAVHARLVLWWPGTDSSCYDLSMVSSWN